VTSLWFAALGSEAQVRVPAPPARFRAYLRYEINAVPQHRAEQFLELLSALKTFGFEKDPRGPEDEFAEVIDRSFVSMTGTIGSMEEARKIATIRWVQAILLYPQGFSLPKGPKDPIKVSIDVTSFGDLSRQKALAAQVRSFLKREGFEEYLGYDNRTQSRLVGTLPSGRLENILQDLRPGQPELARQGPISVGRWPIRIVEVMPDPPDFEPIKPYIPPPPPPDGWAAISPELSPLLPFPGEKTEKKKIEVILSRRPAENDRRFEEHLLRVAPDSVIEYRLGAVVAIKTGLENVAALAKSREVRTIRLPRPAAPSSLQAPAEAEAHPMALRTWSARRLYEQGGLGRGIHVAVISDDFRGYQRFIRRGLPRNVELLDLTAEREEQLQPEPLPGDPLGIGSAMGLLGAPLGEGPFLAGAALFSTGPIGVGTYQALAVAYVAPLVKMTLIRISSSCPYQLDAIARYLAGETPETRPLDRQSTAIQFVEDNMRREQHKLLQERREILEAFRDDDEARRKLDLYFQKQRDFDLRHAKLHKRMFDYLKLRENLHSLKDVSVVASTLTWIDGYPVDGGGPLSRRLDDQVSSPCAWKRPLWLQAAGDTQGQCWSGLYRDDDDNGIMEFAPPTTPLHRDRWGHELNFLGWQTQNGTTFAGLLPLGAKREAQRLGGPFGDPALVGTFARLPGTPTIRLTLQWREPRDPDLDQDYEDRYRTPLANLGLAVLRQRDPSGRNLPSDDLELVARSVPVADRVAQQIDHVRGDVTSSVVYEQILDFRLERAGRYAVWIEGKVNKSIRPKAGATTDGADFPLTDVSWELRPRLLVQVLDPEAQAAGHPVWLDYVSSEGTLGTPADAQAVITVGAADVGGRPRFYSSLGPPFNLSLLPKPDIWVPDGLQLVGGALPVTGTAISAGFAAGAAAGALSLGLAIDTIRSSWTGTGIKTWDFRARAPRNPGP
jgi:hypothetical protein